MEKINVGYGIGKQTGKGIINNFGNMSKNNTGNQTVTWNFDKPTKSIINNVEYVGKSVGVVDNEIYVDGVKQSNNNNNNKNDDNDGKKFVISIVGDVDKLQSDGNTEIDITGNANNIKIVNGDIKVSGDVKGNAETTNGDINAKKIYGKASTINGNVRHQK
jgi:hypothetical protein